MTEFQGKEKNIICTTEQLEEFLQQRNDIILDEVIIQMWWSIWARI